MWLDKANICNKICAFEISDSAIQKIKARQLKNLVDVIRFDGYKIPFEDNFFDLIICSHVIEHVNTLDFYSDVFLSFRYLKSS